VEAFERLSASRITVLVIVGAALVIGGALITVYAKRLAAFQFNDETQPGRWSAVVARALGIMTFLGGVIALLAAAYA